MQVSCKATFPCRCLYRSWSSCCARTKVRRIGHLCQRVRANPPTPIDSSTRCASGARRILSPPSEEKGNICLKQRGNSSAGQATENALPRTPRPPLAQDMQVRQNFLPPDAPAPLNMNRDPCKFPARQHFRAGVCIGLGVHAAPGRKFVASGTYASVYVQTPPPP